jgi:DNA-binding NarL/FixJ family response regulator
VSRTVTASADIAIVGEGADGSEVADLVDRLRPDVVLMDIRMPTVDGLAATEALRGRPDAPEVVVLTTFHADEQVLRAIRAGAAGFVLKDTPPAQIVDSVRRVAAGDPGLSPAVTRQLMDRAAGTGAGTGADDRAGRAQRARRRIAGLAEREREVAVAVGRGRSNAEIAASLYLSVATVKTHEPCPDRAVGARCGAARRGGRRRGRRTLRRFDPRRSNRTGREGLNRVRSRHRSSRGPRLHREPLSDVCEAALRGPGAHHPHR